MIGVYGNNPERQMRAADERRARIEQKRVKLAARLEKMAR